MEEFDYPTLTPIQNALNLEVRKLMRLWYKTRDEKIGEQYRLATIKFNESLKV